jgi:hypothetical protein
MKTILAIMIIVLLLVGTVAFALPAIGAPLAPQQPLPLSITGSGTDYAPRIACDGVPCDCQSC